MDYSAVAPRTCVLKTNIHCGGCEKKVKKVLQRIHGVYSVNIDAEQGKIIVSGTVDPYILIMMLAKAGKKAQLLLDQMGPSPSPAPAPVPPRPPALPMHNHQNQLEFHFNNMHVAPSPSPPPPRPPPGPIQQKSNGTSPFAQLQQLAKFKKLKHLELTQSRGIKMTFNGIRDGMSHGDDQSIKLLNSSANGSHPPPLVGPFSPHPPPGFIYGAGPSSANGHQSIPRPGPPLSPSPSGFSYGVGLSSSNGHQPMPPPAPRPPPSGFSYGPGPSSVNGHQPMPPPGPMPPADLFTSVFSDEHPNGCIVM